MIMAMLCIAIYMLFFMNTYIAKMDPVLIFESIALMAFGVSWLVKGNTLFRD